VAENITYDKAYDAVDRDDFMTMIEVDRYADRSDAFDSIISSTVDHFWDPLDPRYVDYDVPFDMTQDTILPRQMVVELQCAVGDKLDEGQKIRLANQNTRFVLSSILHGEQGALMTAAALTHAVPDHEGKLYAATQTMDEARHVEVYERYIRKLSIVYPISPWLKELIDVTLSADNFAKTMIGMNMVVEGLALAAFHNMRRQANCPLLRDLTGYVLQDESRHVAFGNIYLKEVIGKMHDDEKEDVAQFAFDAVSGMVSAMGGVDGKGQRKPDPGFLKVLEHSGIDMQDFIKGLQEAGAAGINGNLPPGHIHSFKDLMMPALVRVGAVTDRSRELFKEAGIPVWDDLTVLESMEDTDTGVADFDELN